MNTLTVIAGARHGPELKENRGQEYWMLVVDMPIGVDGVGGGVFVHFSSTIAVHGPLYALRSQLKDT